MEAAGISASLSPPPAHDGPVTLLSATKDLSFSRAAVLAGLLRAAGLEAPYTWISSTPVAILAASVSLFIGLPVAFVINLWPITRIGLHRGAGEVEGVVALELAPLQLFVVLVALIAGGLFAGHLAADSYACLTGVRSAC